VLRRPPDGENASIDLYTDNWMNLPIPKTYQLQLTEQFHITCGSIKNWMMKLFYLSCIAKWMDFSRTKSTYSVISNRSEPTFTNKKQALILSTASM